MKNIITSILLFASMSTFAQVTWEDWTAAADTNIYLQPKFGYAEKTEFEKGIDAGFIEKMLEKDSTRSAASNELIKSGFRIITRDVMRAMIYFNQAYMLDSTNSEIYRGFGAVYVLMGQYEMAKEQLQQGLKVQPSNKRILLDYGTIHMVSCYDSTITEKSVMLERADSSLYYMHKVYELDPNLQDLNFKMSMLYMNKDDCENARKYYGQSVQLAGGVRNVPFEKSLDKNCQASAIR